MSVSAPSSPFIWHSLSSTPEAQDWDRLLPPCGLLDSVGRATAEDVVGDLDAVLRLDLLWPGDPAEPLAFSDEDEDDEEQLALDRRARELFESVLAEAGRAVPATVGELAELLVDLGVLVHDTTGTGQQRWRIAQPVPRPCDVLPVPEEWTRKQDEIRLHTAALPAVSDLLSLFDRTGTTELDTRIERLAKDREMTVDQVRAGLVSMSMTGDLRLQRRGPDSRPEEVDPSTVASHARITIIVDWDHVDRTRMRFQLAVPD
jgi:hypothetical protein